MNQPIDYANYAIERESLLLQIQETYGCRCENLSLKEKLFLIQKIAQYLGGIVTSGEVRDEVEELAIRIYARLSPDDQEGLMETLVAQVRNM